MPESVRDAAAPPALAAPALAAPAFAAPAQAALAPPAPAADTAVARAVSPAPACANCGASVAGKFCGNCGQRLHSPVHSVWHFIGEATEDLTHADSRVWRTLFALLVKPGFLTREFLDGRRASYLPPVRLYLVLSVIFFLLAAMWTAPVAVVQADGQGPKVTVASVDRVGAPQPGETDTQRQKRVCNLHYRGWGRATLEPALQRACTQVVAGNMHSLREAFFHILPRAMFVFLPLLAAAMTLLYWRPRHYYVEQLLLLIHNHAFVFLVAILSWIVQRVVPESMSTSWWMILLRLALQAYIAIYVYRSMRRVYGQGRWLTTGKFVVMSFAYLVSAFFMFALTAVFTVLSV